MNKNITNTFGEILMVYDGRCEKTGEIRDKYKENPDFGVILDLEKIMKRSANFYRKFVPTFTEL